MGVWKLLDASQRHGPLYKEQFTRTWGKTKEKGSRNQCKKTQRKHIDAQTYEDTTTPTKTKREEKKQGRKRMSLMTLFAGQPTHMDRSLHDLMFAPTSCRSRCGSGSVARRHCGGARMDVIEHSDKYDLVVDAPGLTPADIHVKLEDGVLSVEGKHEVRETKEDSAGKVIYSER